MSINVKQHDMQQANVQLLLLLTSTFTRITINVSIQTYMKELLYRNDKQNKVLSNKHVVGLWSTIDPFGSNYDDVSALATTNPMSS